MAGAAAAKALVAVHLRLRLKLWKKKTNVVLKIRSCDKLEKQPKCLEETGQIFRPDDREGRNDEGH